MWSLGLCRNIPAQSCVIMWSPGLKLLFGFCLDFLLPKNLDNTGE